MADVTANGVRFNVQRLGKGPRKLVFIHGILIDNLSGFYLTLGPALSDTYSLIMYDLRGHGRSERPRSGYSLQQMTLDLRELLNQLGLGSDKVTLVGNSSGVPIALAYALEFPQQVEAMVLIDGVMDAHVHAQKILETLMVRDGKPHPDDIAIWKNWLRQHTDGDLLDRDGEDTEKLLKRLYNQRRSPLIRTSKALVYETDFVKDMQTEPPYQEEDLERIKCPVLALYGSESDLTDEAERTAQRIPQCQFVRIPGAGHGILRQAAEPMRQTLTSWLECVVPVAS